MKISLTDLNSLLFSGASKIIPKKEAEYFADQTIKASLLNTHDLEPIRRAVVDLESWQKNPKTKCQIQAEKPSSLLINFNKLGPSLQLKFIHDKLIQKAKKTGIATVGFNNSAGTSTLNLWTLGLAEQDMIGIFFFNGGSGSVVAYGTGKNIFGTNPISYAIPTNKKPILADFATSEIAYFTFKNALDKNKSLPEGTIVDQDGSPTTSPKKAIADNGKNARILPIGGGYKGYAIVLLLEILTGSLIRSNLSSLEKSTSYTAHECGGLLMAIDIASLTNLKEFKKSVSSMCKFIRSQKPALGHERVYIPGDQSLKRAEKIKKQGMLELKLEYIDKLKKLSS